MSQLKQVLTSALKAKNASPIHINELDTYLYRSILRLQKKKVLPPRSIQLNVGEVKQEKRIGSNKYANFIYMPEDYGGIQDFQVFNRPVYYWKGDEYSVLNKDETDTRNYFSVVEDTPDEDTKNRKILFANPFPDDDEIIRIKYTVSKVDNYDWITEDYWEAVISDIEMMIGLQDPIEADNQAADAIANWREPANKNATNKTMYKTKTSYFGNHRRRSKTLNNGSRN